MIVGLCGYAKVGKDTAAANMPGWVRRAFADELKTELYLFLRQCYGFDPTGPWTDEDPAAWASKKEILRPFLVEHGRIRRIFDPNYWIDKLYGRHVGHWFDQNYVITDVRYLNEARWVVEKMGGKLVYIHRPNFNAANAEEGASIQVVRESRLACATVVNDATPAELGRRVLEVVS